MKTLSLPLNSKGKTRPLSYSSISLWYKDKIGFRKKYYEGIQPPVTKFLVFGKQAEDEVYAGKLPGVPVFKVSQHELRDVVDEVPVVGYLDTFDPDTVQFGDYKSSLSPWTQTMVQQLEQLPLYSFLLKRKYGTVHKTALLVWLETKLTPAQGLLTQGDTLSLTGKFEVFERKIAEWERKRMRTWIRTAAEEISEDYRHYKKVASGKK